MNTPILFIVFNRPATTQRVFEQIARARPKRLYVAADGPRSPEEAVKCNQAREIATAVSWDCDVKTFFRDQNVGCQQGVKGAIDWFFSQEPDGIILEDDCLPSQSFFPYCEALLERYRDDERIGAITGTKFFERPTGSESYFYSKYPMCWGWASWARAWRHYDLELAQWPALRDTNFLAKIGAASLGFETYWRRKFDDCHTGKCAHTWDYQWVYSFWAQNYAACAPAVNLVENIGFGQESGAHHSEYDSLCHGRPATEIIFPLVHPEAFIRNHGYDNQVDRQLYRTGRQALRSIIEEKVLFGSQFLELAKRTRRLVLG